MAGSATNYLENATINHVLRNSTTAAPATVYLGLATAVTDAEAGTITEVTGGSYARQPVTFGAPSGRQTSNTGTITFPTATGNWGTVTHWFLFDAVSGGNALYWAALSASKTVNTSDTFTMAPGNVVITHTGAISTYLSHALLNHFLRATTYTPAATVYTALLTAVADGAAGSVTEVSGGSYARQSTTFSAASGGTTSNSGVLTYPTASAGWGTITAAAVYDASTVGNLLYWTNLATSKAVNSSETFSFAATAVAIGED